MKFGETIYINSVYVFQCDQTLSPFWLANTCSHKNNNMQKLLPGNHHQTRFCSFSKHFFDDLLALNNSYRAKAVKDN